MILVITTFLNKINILLLIAVISVINIAQQTVKFWREELISDSGYFNQ